MKRVINLLLLCLFCTVVQAQDINLTVDITPGGLKDAMSYRQRQRVTNLTLTGSMNDSDFYLIRDSMPKLQRLDMKYVNVDTIPQKAFYSFSCKKCILPISTKYIGDQAFEDVFSDSISITGPFPSLGSRAFTVINIKCVTVSEDNIYCKKVKSDRDDSIYSIDGKILYLCLNDSRKSETEIAIGTEIIENRSFDNFGIYRLFIPSSVILIKKEAFVDIKNMAIDQIGPGDYSAKIICEGEIPPVLEPNAFMGEWMSSFDLCVPYGKVNIYKQADAQWSKFSQIQEPVSILSVQRQKLNVYKIDESICIESDDSIQKIICTTFSGVHLYTGVFKDKKVILPTYISTNFIGKIFFWNGTTTSFKFIK